MTSKSSKDCPKHLSSTGTPLACLEADCTCGVKLTLLTGLEEKTLMAPEGSFVESWLTILEALSSTLVGVHVIASFSGPVVLGLALPG